MTKTCKACLKVISVECFTRSTNTLDGREGKCKDCRVKERPLFTFTCVICDEVYTTRKRTSNQCCGQKCVGALRSRNYTKEVNCGTCNKAVKVVVSNKLENTYCSPECFSRACAIRMTGENHHAYSQVETTCFNCDKPISRTRRYLEENTHVFCNKSCFSEGIGITRRGELHPGYNFEITDEERMQGRSYFEYSEWRKNVFERDAYSCVICNASSGANLNAHHLYSHHSHRELRLDLDNGITACEDCHKKFHKLYGYRFNTPYEFTEFMIGEQFRIPDMCRFVSGDLNG